MKFFETLFKTRDDKVIWVAITASKIKGLDDHEYVEGIIENISAHKNTEESLSIERNFLQSVLDNIPDAIYFKDHVNRIVKVNKFYAQGIGLTTEEIIGKTDFDFFPAEQAKQMFSDDNQVVQTGQPIIGKIEHTLLPNGTWNQAITTKIPIYDQKGKVAARWE